MIGITGRLNLDAQAPAAERFRISGGQSFISDSGVVVSFDGRLDNRAELGPSWNLSDAACVAAVYEQTGERFASHLNGDFALALFDPSKHALTLARDVMGARRLHYTQVGQTLLFASDIKSLLAYPGVRSAPDEDALADLVFDRWLDGHRTCFRGIYAVPPGQLLAATPGGIARRPHWAFDPAREIRYRTVDEYTDCFRALFEQAVRRRLRSTGPIAVSVSGGVDSSSIFCQASALTGRDRAAPAMFGISLTYPAGSAADERQFLDVLDRACGSPVTRLPFSTPRLLAGAGASIAQVEMPTLFWDPHVAVFEEARRRGCSVLLDGYFGDQVLFPGAYLIDLAWRGRFRTIRRDLREFAAWMTDPAPSEFARDFRHGLLRSMIPQPLFRAAKRTATRRRASRYPAWYTETFVRRLLERQMTRFPPRPRSASRHAEECYLNATAGHFLFHAQRQCSVARMYGLDLAYPFRDRDLVAFLMAVPGEVVTPRGVPKGLLRAALSGTVPEPIRLRRWKADFTALSNRAVLEDYGTIARLLTRDSLAVQWGFIDGRVIEQSLSTARVFQDENGEPGWQLSDAVALELWLRHFFGDGVVDGAEVPIDRATPLCTT